MEGEIVMTADMERIKSGELDEIIDESVKTNSMVKKATRISASLLKEENEEGAYYVTSGAVEGDISRFWINTGLSLSSAFSKEKEEDAVWYSDAEGSLSLYVPQNGVLLFTDGDYPSFYRRSYTQREMLISDEIALKMASSVFSVYVFEPESLSG